VIQGEERLLAAAREEQARRSESPARAILHRVLGTVVPKDDVAVLTLALASVPGRRIEMTVLATAEAPARIRHAFRRAASAFGVHGERAFSLQVALGEAVTNAVEHAYGLELGPVSVRMWCENGVLIMEVEDRGRWRPERDQGRGRGTAIMRALVDRLEIEPREGGTLVRLVTQLDREDFALPGTAAVSSPLIPHIPRRPEDASVQRRD
jgi:anti-sigma regulatory factor (Ser/Thr protein kinase)